MTTAASAPEQPTPEAPETPPPVEPRKFVRVGGYATMGINFADSYRSFAGLGIDAFTEEEAALLAKNVPDDELMILPTGEVYLHQVGYRLRLNDVFGPAGWALFPFDEEPRIVAASMRNQKILWQRWMLIVRGRVVAIAPGETAYDPESRSAFSMSLATAIESAKSNALMRCCKDIGVAAQCWDRKFADGWRDMYAVRVYRVDSNGEQKDEWRLLLDGPHWNEVGVHPGSPNKAAHKAQIEAAGGYMQPRASGGKGVSRPPRQSQGQPTFDDADQRHPVEAMAQPAAAKKPAAAKPAAAKPAATKPAADAQPGDAKTISEPQYGYLKGLLKQSGLTADQFFEWLNTTHKIAIDNGRQLPAAIFNTVKAFLEQKAIAKNKTAEREPGQEG